MVGREELTGMDEVIYVVRDLEMSRFGNLFCCIMVVCAWQDVGIEWVNLPFADDAQKENGELALIGACSRFRVS
jgi:hypothetical protein